MFEDLNDDRSPLDLRLLPEECILALAPPEPQPMYRVPEKPNSAPKPNLGPEMQKIREALFKKEEAAPLAWKITSYARESTAIKSFSDPPTYCATRRNRPRHA